MNTLTLNEIAAGGGVFEGRYAQTLAQEIIALREVVEVNAERLSNFHREYRAGCGEVTLERAEHAEREVANWRNSQMRTWQRLEAAMRERDDARRELAEARRWLSRNGGHTMGCVKASTPQLRCTCGYIEAMGTGS